MFADKGEGKRKDKPQTESPTVTFSASPWLSPQLSSLTSPKGTWPGPSTRQHLSFPDKRHVPVATPRSISVAVDLGDKMLSPRAGGRKLLEGRILVFSEITLSLESLYF